MSAYEQKLEPPDRQWQYLLFAAEPYETISFKVCTYMYANEVFSMTEIKGKIQILNITFPHDINFVSTLGSFD